MGFRSYAGYTRSENGWRICDTAEVVKVIVPGTTQQIEVRRGDAATILVAWMIWYHRNVEPIDRYKPRDDWGFSWDNDVPNSNHLSATAVDINATQYPWQQRTMPADRVEKVRRGLKLFEGTIFWGRDWSRVDEMHYQIGFPEGDPRVAAFAKRLNEGYLGLYGEDNSAKPEEDDMPSWLSGQVKNFKGIAMGWKDIFWFMDRNTSQARDQLLGEDDGKGGFKGWKILGRSKVDPNRDNTVVEAVAELKNDVAEIKAILKEKRV